MTHQSETKPSALCAAIEAAQRIAEEAGNTLVSALLSEAYEAGLCDEAAFKAE